MKLVMDSSYTCLGYFPNLEPILTPLKRAQPVYFLDQAVENGFGMQRFLQDRHARVKCNYVGRQVSVGVDDKGNASVSEICRYGQGVPIVEMVVHDRARNCFVFEQFQRVRDRFDRTHDTPILILDGVRKIERQVDIVFDDQDGVIFEYAGLPLGGSASVSQSSGLPSQPRR